MQIQLQNIQIEFIYQFHQAKFKVTAANRSYEVMNVIKYTFAIRRWSTFDRKTILLILSVTVTYHF